jgi:hypothetical protein
MPDGAFGYHAGIYKKSKKQVESFLAPTSNEILRQVFPAAHSLRRYGGAASRAA